MTNLAKIILFSSPLLFFILFYVISSQRSHDVEMKKQDAAFEESWHKESASMEKNKELKKWHEQKAQQAERELVELKKKEKEREQKDEQFEQSMEKALKETK